MDNLTTRRTLVLGSVGIALSTGLVACGSSETTTGTQQQPQGARERGLGAAPTLGLGIVGLIVADLDASLKFYRRLGLDIPQNVRGDYFRLRLPTGQVFFWDTYEVTRDYDPSYKPATGDRKVVLEFGFRRPDEVDAMHNDLVAAGYESYLRPLTMGPTRYALVEDPDGNQVGLRFPLAS